MDKFDRICQLHQEFSQRRSPIKISALAEQLECSEKTIKRAITQLRDQLYAPLVYMPEYHGWRYSPDKQHKFELPGLWMTENELVSLILLLSILETFGNGLLSQEMQRTHNYISQLFTNRGLNKADVNSKVKVLPIAQKILPSKTFYTITEALFKNKRVSISYIDFNNKQTERTLSPQTLVYYRDNWYLDAWCHLRKQLRTFTIARMTKARIENGPIKKIQTAQLAEYFSKSYGIFSGKADNTAKLKFAPRIAREIAMQSWHDDQMGYWHDDAYILEIPYGQSNELLMDIMRYLPDVEVLEPISLKQAVKDRIEQAYQLFFQ